MARRSPLLLLAAFLLLMAAAGGAGAQGQFTVRGKVWDRAAFAPIAGALVMRDGTDRVLAVTSATGEFVLRLPAGPHRLRVMALGFASGTLEVTAAPDALPVAIALDADPVMLEQLVVLGDRFEVRRKAVGVSSMVIGDTELQMTSSRHLAELVGRHVRSGPAIDCQARTLHYGEQGLACQMGRLRSPAVSRTRVYIDEVPIVGGLETLQTLNPKEIARVEIFEGGKQVRVYSVQFMERAARLGLEPQPLTMPEQGN